MTVTFITTLYQGEDVPPWSKDIFDATWADKLYRGIARHLHAPFNFVCLVDKPYDFQEAGIRPVYLENPYRNMWCLLECLRPDIDGHQKIFMGLDTIINGDLSEISNYRGDFAMIRDPYYPDTRASGVMSFSQAAAAPIYEKFKADQNKGDFRLANQVSDMIWLDKNIPACDLLQDIFPTQILSYKVEVIPKPWRLPDARIVYFHGVPKPHELDTDWVKENWK